MLRFASRCFAGSPAFLLLALVGCGSDRRQWEITVENRSDTPCSFFVTYDAPGGKGGAQVEDVARGKVVKLVAGPAGTVVQSVRIVRGKDEQTLTPKEELPAGTRYAILVNADGKVEASASGR